MNKFIYVLILLSTAVYAQQNVIITQGQVQVTFDDVDGYAYGIPLENRAGFFESPQRIDNAINKLLLMKQLVNYGKKNNLIPSNKIRDKVMERLLDLPPENVNIIDMSSHATYALYKKFIQLEESYKYMIVLEKSKINKDDLDALAREQYLINKDKYYIPEERSVDYINIKYDTNKKAQNIKANDILNQIISKHMSIKDISNDYNDTDNIDFVLDLNHFAYDNKYRVFSSFVFKPPSLGVINKVLDAQNRFIIAEIINIIPAHTKTYDEVKESLLTKLMKNKSERKIRNLILKLTKDSVDIKKDNLIALRSRYLIK